MKETSVRSKRVCACVRDGSLGVRGTTDQPDAWTSNQSLSHELGIERASKRANECAV